MDRFKYALRKIDSYRGRLDGRNGKLVIFEWAVVVGEKIVRQIYEEYKVIPLHSWGGNLHTLIIYYNLVHLFIVNDFVEVLIPRARWKCQINQLEALYKYLRFLPIGLL